MDPKLRLEYWEDDGWFVGRLVGIPSIFSQGETIEELVANIREVYQLMMEDTDPVPENVSPRFLEIDIQQ